MFEVENYVIHISRATKGAIEFGVPEREFNVGDTIELRIYEKNGLDKLPVKTIEKIVMEAGPTMEIQLTCEDTNIGEPCNKVVDYWYEIELNDDITVIGFDRDGPKILKLYPKGVEKNDQS